MIKRINRNICLGWIFGPYYYKFSPLYIWQELRFFTRTLRHAKFKSQSNCKFSCCDILFEGLMVVCSMSIILSNLLLSKSETHTEQIFTRFQFAYVPLSDHHYNLETDSNRVHNCFWFLHLSVLVQLEIKKCWDSYFRNLKR